MMEGSVHLIDLVKRRCSNLKDHNKYVVRSAFSDDGKWLYTAGFTTSQLVRSYRTTGRRRVMPYWTARKKRTGVMETFRRKFQLGHLLSGPSHCCIWRIHSGQTAFEEYSNCPEGLVFLRDSTAVYGARDHILPLHWLTNTFALSDLTPNGDSWVSFDYCTSCRSLSSYLASHNPSFYMVCRYPIRQHCNTLSSKPPPHLLQILLYPFPISSKTFNSLHHSRTVRFRYTSTFLNLPDGTATSSSLLKMECWGVYWFTG
jgi:hypothetical protein